MFSDRIHLAVSKKIRDTKGTFHAKKGSIKDRNGMDLTEAEDTKKRWQVLGSITTNKASGGDGFQVELFQILKDDAVIVLHSICQQIWKTQQWSQDWKRYVFIPSPKKGHTKNVKTTPQLHSSHTLVK